MGDVPVAPRMDAEEAPARDTLMHKMQYDAK